MYTKQGLIAAAANMREAAADVESYARMSGRESELLPLAVWLEQIADELEEKAQ